VNIHYKAKLVQVLVVHSVVCRSVENEMSKMMLNATKFYIHQHAYMLKTFSLPTDAHNVKKHRVIKTF